MKKARRLRVLTSIPFHPCPSPDLSAHTYSYLLGLSVPIWTCLNIVPPVCVSSPQAVPHAAAREFVLRPQFVHISSIFRPRLARVLPHALPPLLSPARPVPLRSTAISACEKDRSCPVVPGQNMLCCASNGSAPQAAAQSQSVGPTVSSRRQRDNNLSYNTLLCRLQNVAGQRSTEY